MSFSATLRASACLIAFASTSAAFADDTDTSFGVGDEIIVTAKNMAGSSANVITSVDTLGPDVAQNANVNYA